MGVLRQVPPEPVSRDGTGHSSWPTLADFMGVLFILTMREARISIPDVSKRKKGNLGTRRSPGRARLSLANEAH